MRIGIITLPLHTNYGGILQAYALETILKSQGHEVCHIEEKHYPQKVDPRLIIPKVIKRLIIKIFRDKRTRIYSEAYYNKSYPIITQYTLDFVKKNLNLRTVKTFFDIKEGEYDTFIVGSDQVWRPFYYSKIEKMYLSFAKGWDIKRLAYSASLGTDKWEYSESQTKECRKLLKDFNLISVREQSGVKLIKEHFGLNAIQVLDPTMLLTAADYLALLDKNPSEQNSIMQYILDENDDVYNKIKSLASKENLIVKRANSRFEDIYAPVEQRIQPPVESWLNSFVESKLVITDSFHATVFSILFHKPFYVLVNPQRGASRIIDLLAMFGLSSRIIYGQEDFNSIDYNIDWVSVEKILIQKRNMSKGALNKALRSL